MSFEEGPAQLRRRFVQAWLAGTLKSYPGQTGRFLREERDPFRNPVGSTFRAAFETLAEELTGGFDRARVAGAVDAVVRVRAVQDFSEAEAVGFVGLARDAAREAAPDDPAACALVEARLGELAALAEASLHACREQIREIAVRAARRRDFVPERVRARAQRRAATLPAPRGNPV